MPKKNKIELPSNKELMEMIGDRNLYLFFLSWLKHNKNATEAYLEHHPNVDRLSAKVMGCKYLKRINIDVVMDAYGLGRDRYFQQLEDGLSAEKQDVTGMVHPDHRTRREYHKALGNLLKIETNSEPSQLQVNIFNESRERAKKYVSIPED